MDNDQLVLSSIKEKEAKKLGIGNRELVMADLMCIGYTEKDAYAIAFHGPTMAQSSDFISKRRNEKVKNPKFKRALEARKEVHKANGIAVDADVDDELLDKRTTAKLIMSAAMKQPADSKERIEGLMKYSELMRYKSDDVEGSATDNIHFFLPLKCSQCPLFNEYNRKKKASGEAPMRPDEMNNLVKGSDTQEDA